MPRKKKSMALTAAAVILSASVLGACGTDESAGDGSDKQPTDSGKTASEAYSLPFVKDGTGSLTVGVPDNRYAPKSYTQNLPVWSEIEKRTGVKVNWDVTAVAQYNQAMNIRLAAASGLPDILQLPGTPVNYGTDGIIRPLNELIDKYAPNIKKYFADNPAIANLHKAPDGNIYALSADISGTTATDPMGWLIRKDWLDKLGLKEPTTLDEWYDVLKAFKEKDPNGNGKPDEIPLSPQYTWGGLALFGNALGLHLAEYSYGYSVDANGKIKNDWLDPKAKELIVWLNKLYAEGLLDPEFMSKKSDKILADITREVIGSTNHLLNATSKFNSAIGKPDANWIMTLPPANGGNKRFYEKAAPISGYWAISKDAKNPELAIKWLDYIYANEEGQRLVAYGIEGVSYKMVNGKPEFTDFVLNNPDKLDSISALRSLGAFPNTPWIRAEKGALSGQPEALLKSNPQLLEQAKRIEPYLIDNTPLKYVLPTPEEADLEKRLGADLNTYQEETLLKFIYGKEPIDWDKFVKRMKELRVEELIAIKQKQYDRVKK
ncbi:MAG: bacterial extracellular solute-binding protein [Paenibacillus sp.]|jgi:putative aldouronate transport system substrate-binding protein|nr:bacterial extracellular solute-binding protein [Paenibacillus sp.]